MNTSARWHLGVAIPARNEEQLLPRCLTSVQRAIENLAGQATADVVVVVDSSTDRTIDIAARMLASIGSVATIEECAVGIARAVAADHLLRRYHGDLSCCWLANTDADCVVPADWLIDQVRLAESGIEAFAGTVDVDSFHEHGADVQARFKASYQKNADGTHGHVHGANMGIRADAYIRAGGWNPLQTAEDHDLWNRLGRVGARRFSTTGIEVLTSGRRVGRAPLGFAGALAAHNESAA